jgi:cholesterol transport system auxiliary component
MMPDGLFRSFLVLLVCIALAGCAVGRSSTPVTLIAPQPEVAVGPAWPAVDAVLQIQRPVADRTRDSDRILVRGSGSRLQVYPASAWIDAAPDMVQTLLVQALVDSGRLGGVTRTGGEQQLRLGTEIRRFEAADAGGAGLAVELEIHASLVDARSARILAARTFRQETAAGGTTLDPLVAAFEAALAELVTDIVGWVLVEAATADLAAARR